MTELILDGKRPLARGPESEGDNVFHKFRDLYRADWCATRKVYWFDTGSRQTRLRQMLVEGRTRKADDKLIGIYPGEPNVDVLRLAIAAANDGHILTGVRWELCSDFACESIVASGRFDHFDLCPSSDPSELRGIAALGGINVDFSEKRWDFDALILAHTCPTCGKIYGKDNLGFNPAVMHCATCYKNRRTGTKAIGAANGTAKILLAKLTRSDAGRLRAARTPDAPRGIGLLDLVAAPLLCYVVGQMRSPLRSVDVRRQCFDVGQVEACLGRSVIGALSVPMVANELQELFEAHYQSQRVKIVDGPGPMLSAATRRRWLADSRDDMRRDISVLAGLRDWLHASDANQSLEFLRQGEGIFDAASLFSLAMEEFADYLWQTHFGEI